MTKTIQTISISFVVMILATTSVNAQALTTSLEIKTPSEGQTIYGNKIAILFSVDNFEIVDYSDKTTAVSGQGHVHVWLDNEEQTAQSATKVTEEVFTISDVDFGQHTMTAELVGNTHQSFTPPITTSINFTNATISTPDAAATSGFDKQTAFVILIVVALVIVAAWWYTKDEDDEDFLSDDKPTKKKAKKKKTAKKEKR